MVPSGNRLAASQDLSVRRSALSGVSKGRSHLSPYARPRRHFSHMLPVFGGPAITTLTVVSPRRSPTSSKFLRETFGMSGKERFHRFGTLLMTSPPPHPNQA